VVGLVELQVDGVEGEGIVAYDCVVGDGYYGVGLVGGGDFELQLLFFVWFFDDFELFD